MPKLPPVMSLSAIRAVPPRLTTMPPLVVFGLLAMSIVLLAIDRLVEIGGLDAIGILALEAQEDVAVAPVNLASFSQSDKKR